MLLFELTNAEIKQGKNIWKDPKFNDEYKSHGIQGNTLEYDPSEDPEYDGKIWNSITKADRNRLRNHASDHFDDPKIHTTLEKVIAMSEPIGKNVISYRGILLINSKVKEIVKKLEAGKTISLKNRHPTSFTDYSNAAWSFANSNKRLFKMKSWGTKTYIPILLEILIPAETKVARIDLHNGIGFEHVVSAKTKIKLTKYSKYRSGLKFSGYLIKT